MTEKEKAATQNVTTPTKQGDLNTKTTKIPTLLELVACYLLNNGTIGISALSALAGLSDLNARNSISKLRRLHGIHILDEYFTHPHSGGGIAHLKRYWLADRDQARKLAELVNFKRKQRGATPLSQYQVARYLAAFPTTTPTTDSHQPPA